MQGFSYFWETNKIIMENFKGTPGPWHPINIAGWWHIHKEPFYDATDILDEDETPLGVAKRNATLAAAAPDLLETLQYLEKWVVDMPANQFVLEKIKAAIDKALKI